MPALSVYDVMKIANVKRTAARQLMKALGAVDVSGRPNAKRKIWRLPSDVLEDYLHGLITIKAGAGPVAYPKPQRQTKRQLQENGGHLIPRRRTSP